MNWKRIWGQTAYRRLVISLLAILLPLYILSILIYQWGQQTLKNELSQSMINQVTQYLTNLETDFDRVRSLLYDALSDTNLNALATISESMDDIEKVQSILRLQQRLNAIRNSSQYIDDVHAFIPGIERNISALTVNEFDEEMFTELKELQYDLDTPVFRYNNGLYIVVSYPFLSPSSNREPIMMLAVQFSISKLAHTLDTMRQSDNEGLIYNSEEFILLSNQNQSIKEHIIQAVTSSTKQEGSDVVLIDGKKYLTVFKRSTFFGADLIKYIPEETVFAPLTKYKMWFLVLAVTSIFILIIYALYLFKYIHKPLDRLVKAFRRVEQGDMSVQIRHGSHDEFEYIYSRFNDMLDNFKTLIDEVYKQQILMQKAELKHLQSQINPHFLYNSFFILNTMARLGDTEQLERFTLQLGEYFQFITRNNADDVLLSKEVQHAKVYAEIQGMRFSNRVSIEFNELPDQLGHIAVPRLIIQPLIENAFEHAIEKKLGSGLLRIEFTKQVQGFEVSIEDNGEQLDEGKIELLNHSLIRKDTTDSTAVLNIHQRIRLKFGEQSGLHFERNEWGGLKAVIKIVNKEAEA